MIHNSLCCTDPQSLLFFLCQLIKLIRESSGCDSALEEIDEEALRLVVTLAPRVRPVICGKGH